MSIRQGVVSLLGILCLLYQPSTAADPEIIPDVVYGHKHGMALTLDTIKPADEANGAGVLFVVSGGWVSRWVPPERMAVAFRPLLDRGFTLFVVRHGSSPKFTIPEIVDDVRSAVRFVRLHADDYGIDPDRLGVFGHSAGGHLSLVLGTTGDNGDPKASDKRAQVSSRVQAVVAYFPPTDIRPWVDESSRYWQNYPALRFDADLADDFSPLLHVSADDAPTLLLHGDKDELVPIEHSRKILKAFEDHEVPAELVVIEGAAHGFRDKDAKRAIDATLDWLSRQLVPDAPEGVGAE